MLLSYLFWLWKFLLHPMGVSSFGSSDVLAWSLLSLLRFLMRLFLLHVEFQGLRGGWLRLLRDFDLLDLFH